MKDRTIRLKSAQFRRTSPVGISSIALLTPMYSETFSVVTTVEGDFKTPNPCEFSKEQLTSRQGRRLQYWTATDEWIEELTGNFGCDVPFPAGTFSGNVSAGLYNRVVADLYDQLRGGLDLTVSLGESGQTADMFRSVGAAVGYVKNFRPSDLKLWYKEYTHARIRPTGDKVSSAARKAGGKWLTYTYGLKPLVQDVYDCADRLQNHVSAPVRVRARGTESEESVITYMFDHSTLVKGTVDGKRSERIELVVSYAPEPSVLQFMAGFGSLNPASIAWELTPYSFVVDWFFNVGGYLRSLETALLFASSFQGGYVTKSIVMESTLRPTNAVYSAGGQTWLYSMGPASSRNVWKQRARLDSTPIPRPPVLKVELGPQRLLNAAALLSQHLGLKRGGDPLAPHFTNPRGGSIPKFK